MMRGRSLTGTKREDEAKQDRDPRSLAGDLHLLDDHGRPNRRPLVKERHRLQWDVNASVRPIGPVGPGAVYRAPRGVVDEVSAVVVEHRVLHPGAGVPVRAALWPGRDELVGRVFGFDAE